jgi:hypothetical protein
LYKAERTNADSEIKKVDGGTNNTLYKNGLTSSYLYSFVSAVGDSATYPTSAYPMNANVIAKILDNGSGSFTLPDFFQDTQSLLINAVQKIYEFQGTLKDAP